LVLTGGRVTTESSLDRLALLLPDEDTDPVSSVSPGIILSATAKIAFARSEYPHGDRWTPSCPDHSGVPLLAVLSLKAETDIPSVEIGSSITYFRSCSVAQTSNS
jgi:hypothetical protein